MLTRSTSACVLIPTSIGIAWDRGETMPFVVKAFMTLRDSVVGSTVGSWGNYSSLKNRWSPLTYLVVLVA